jgi:TPR repeat protein
VQKASEQGHPWSPSSWGFILQSGGDGVQRDIAKAKQLYELSIDLGHPQGYYYLGGLYEEGIGVQKNEKEAVRLYCIAADMGLDVAQCSLGNCYDFGTGVRQNLEEALKWYRASAEQGENATAMNNTGAFGNDITWIPAKNGIVPEAYLWFKRAARLDDADGACTAGQIESNCRTLCAQCKKNDTLACSIGAQTVNFIDTVEKSVSLNTGKPGTRRLVSRQIKFA